MVDSPGGLMCDGIEERRERKREKRGGKGRNGRDLYGR
jgi:hypothetical protein